MKLIQRILVTWSWCIIALWGFVSTEGMAQSDPSCPKPPAVLHIQYAFDWPVIEQQKLAKSFALRCGSPSDLDKLLKLTAASLAEMNKTLIRSQIVMKDELGQSRISLNTEQDDQRLRTAILPITHLTRDNRYFLMAEIVGKPVEGERLLLRYAVDEARLSGVDGEVNIVWLRDGAPISGKRNTKLLLVEEFAGSNISAKIEFVDKRGFAYATRSASMSSAIRLKPTPPEARKLVVKGDAVIGNTLSVSYEFFDRNPEDTELGSQIQWMRDGYAIPDATTKTYVIVPQDLGTNLSVKLVPRSNDGQRGTAYIAEAKTAVQDELTSLRPKILATVNSDSTELPDFTPIISVPEPIADKPLPEVRLMPPAPPKSSTVVLALGLEVARASPRQFAGIDYSPNDILEQSVLDEIEGRLIGKDITLETIKATLEEVNDAYRQAGFELSRALLPEQVITDGKLKIQLVQTKIGKIRFENNDRLKDDFLRKHLRLEEGEFISIAELERNIRLYNAGNKSKLKSELAPGENFGETDVFVQVEEPDLFELPKLSIDNYANKMTDWRNNSLSFVLNNAFGREDESVFTFTDAKGSSSQAVSISMPLSANGTNLSTSLSRSQTQTVGGDPSIVGYRGRSYSVAMGLSHPILFEDDYSVYLSTSLASSYNQLTQAITGDLLSKSTARKFTLSFPVSYTTERSSYSFAPNWSVINTETKIPPQTVWVQKLDGKLASSHFLSKYATLNTRGNFLYTKSKKLLSMPGEILSVGGPSSVRAYQPSESSGYVGYFVSAELRSDLANWEQVKLPRQMPNLQPYLFIDHMLARSQYRKDTREDYWSGYGFGITIPSFFNGLSLDAYVSESLDGQIHSAEQQAYDEQRVQFSLKANLDLIRKIN